MNFDPTAIVEFAFGFAGGAVTLLGGLVVWVTKKSAADRDRLIVEMREDRERMSSETQAMHAGYQQSMHAMADALQALNQTVAAMQLELKEVRKQARCNAPKTPRRKATE